MKTLIVEDEMTNRLLLENLLLRHGACDTAHEGVAAYEAFRTSSEQGRPYDLVCMDIMMPGPNGTDVVRRIRDYEEGRGILSSRGTKIIMITGANSVRELFRSFENLCDAYLTKPIDGRRLDRHLKEMRLIA